MVGTYSANTSINVSAYSPTSVNDFILQITSVSYSGGLSNGQWSTSGVGYGCHYNATFSPSMSLSGNTLTLSNITQSGSYSEYTSQYGEATLSGSCTLTVKVYYVG